MTTSVNYAIRLAANAHIVTMSGADLKTNLTHAEMFWANSINLSNGSIDTLDTPYDSTAPVPYFRHGTAATRSEMDHQNASFHRKSGLIYATTNIASTPYWPAEDTVFQTPGIFFPVQFWPVAMDSDYKDAVSQLFNSKYELWMSTIAFGKEAVVDMLSEIGDEGHQLDCGYTVNPFKIQTMYLVERVSHEIVVARSLAAYAASAQRMAAVDAVLGSSSNVRHTAIGFPIPSFNLINLALPE
jgi:hypothetical protein